MYLVFRKTLEAAGEVWNRETLVKWMESVPYKSKSRAWRAYNNLVNKGFK